MGERERKERGCSLPSKNSVVDCLYSAQLSPMAAFSSVYTDSRSSRGTEISALVDFCEVDVVEATVLELDVAAALEADSVRLRAAGSICILGRRRTEEKKGHNAQSPICAKPHTHTTSDLHQKGKVLVYTIFLWNRKKRSFL